MINISDKFKNAMKQPVKELDAYLLLDDGTKISSSNYLIDLKLSAETTICKTAMRKLEVSYLSSKILLDKWVQVFVGVRIEDGEFEYINYGSFLITETSTSEDKETTKIVGYDKMINSMVNYEVIEMEYPIDIFSYTQKICEACNLELANETLVNGDITVDRELWENITDTTYRDILTQIAEVTCSMCIIGQDDKVYFNPIKKDSLDVMTYDNLRTFKIEELYGEINYVILGRDPVVGEDIFEKDEESIEKNGLTEFRIDNNQFLDAKREDVIKQIYDGLHGFKFHPSELSTEGHGWYEIGDIITIRNNEEQEFNTIVLNFSLQVDGGIKETIKSSAETKTQSRYQYKSPLAKEVRNTEIRVNKQDQVIEGVVTDVSATQENLTNVTQTVDDITTQVEENKYYIDEDGNRQLISEEVFNLRQNITGSEFTIKSTSGNNIFMNSIGMFGLDYWDDTTAEPYTNTNIQMVTGEMSCWRLNTGKHTQVVTNLKNGIYTIGFLYKKLKNLSNVSVTINGVKYDLFFDNDKYRIDYEDEPVLWEDDNIYYFDEEYEEAFGDYYDFSRTIEVKDNTLTITFDSDSDASCYICNLMGNPGYVLQPYCHSINETTTDTVQIGKGIQIESSSMNTYFRADADGTRIFNKNTKEVISEFTDKGIITKDLQVRGTAQIVGLLVMKVGNQTWITGIEEEI